MDKRNLLALNQQATGVRQRILLACVLSIILATIASEAKVYLRWGLADNIARFIADIGGELAYEADMTVNGRAASISVYGLPASRRAWANSVRSISFNARGAFTSLTGLTISGSSLLFQYQRRTEGAPQEAPFWLPRFPQSTQTFSAHDKQADMSINILRAQAPPAQVRQFYRGSMKEDGWHMPLASNETTPEGMIVFIREQEVACIGIEQVNQNTETRITLLHKKLNIK